LAGWPLPFLSRQHRTALSAQTQALGFYQRLGYTAYGPEFDDAGLPHRWMTRVLG